MPRVKFNKLIAFVVLAGFAAWMGTGKFSSVGSAATEDAAKPAPKEEPKATLRTVAVVTPPHVQHARAIRISGQTDADKRAMLAIRVMGIIEELPVRQGDHVNKGDLDHAPRRRGQAGGRRHGGGPRDPAPGRDRCRRAAGQGRQCCPSCRPTRRAPSWPPPRRSSRSARAELAADEIYAPFNGVIDRVPVEDGSAIMAGGEVATLINLDPLLAIGEVSERDLQLSQARRARPTSGWSTAPPSKARCATSAATRRPRPAPSASRWPSPTRTRHCLPA